jgi:glyoxylase-like metal-dependent hydrolase (beta-lactamase superfamily II)
VLVTGFPAAAFGTNCFVVATGPGEHAVVVDPGVEVVDQLDELLREHRLQLSGISPETAALFGGRLQWSEPDDVRPLDDGAVLEIAGLQITVDHAPGHTPGSVAFRLPGDDVPQMMLSGDLLFAGSIGRTDLPGGDTDEMMRSLARTVLPLDDEVVVLPGHGPETTIGRERATNPFLRGLTAEPRVAPPTRGL